MTNPRTLPGPLFRTLAIALLLAGCASADFEAAPSSSEALAPPDACSLIAEKQHAPSSGSCYRVTAAADSLLVTCDGTVDENEEQTPRGPGYIVTAFDVPPGGCFQFYACNGSAPKLPTVEVCP